MSSRIVRKPKDPEGNILSIITDTKTKKIFQVVRLGKEDIGLVFADEDIISIPIWYFFMIVKGIKDAEYTLIKG